MALCNQQTIKAMISSRKLFWAILAFSTLTFVYCEAEIGEKLGLEAQSEPKIGILPFEDVPQEQVDSVQAAVERMYDIEVAVLERRDLPNMAYTEIRYPRYRADSILEWMDQNQQEDFDIILGLTSQDISITKYKKGTKEIKDPVWQYKDFGIFGLGRVSGSVCVVSSNRLAKNVDYKTFYKRLKRVSCHEIGHVLGLHHCPEANCLMNDANESISTIDKSTGALCEKCKNLIN